MKPMDNGQIILFQTLDGETRIEIQRKELLLSDKKL